MKTIAVLFLCAFSFAEVPPTVVLPAPSWELRTNRWQASIPKIEAPPLVPPIENDDNCMPYMNSDDQWVYPEINNKETRAMQRCVVEI